VQRGRTIIFWLHLAAGVTAGAIISVMSITGALLAIKPLALAVIDRDVRTPPARDHSTPPARLDAIAAAVRAARPDARITTITLQSDPAAAAAVAFDRGAVVYVDAESGAVVGEGSRRAQALFRALEDWHRWLGVPSESRAVGRAVTGACNLAFLALALTGPFLWWPRRWTWSNIRPVIWFRPGTTGRARDFNWHNTIGIWCAPVLVIVTATAVVMSYRWANDLLFRIARSTPPPAAARETIPPSTLDSAVPDRLDALVARAEEYVPTWRSITVRVPPRSGAPVLLSIVDARSWNAFARSQLTLNPSTAAVVKWEPYAATNLGQKMRLWARFAHTGELARWPGQLVAGLASLGGAFLTWTGIALAIRRFAAWRTRRVAALQPSSARLGGDHRNRQRDHDRHGEPRHDVVPLRVGVLPHQLTVVDQQQHEYQDERQ
jgi:uncharacterized iron-regulated membrane protein